MSRCSQSCVSVSTRFAAPAIVMAAGLCISLSAATALAGASSETTPSRADAVQVVPHPWIELNGERYHVEKRDIGGEVVHVYHDGRDTYTWSQLKRHIAAQPPRKITGFLDEVLAEAPADEPVPVVIILRDQPAAPISREVWGRVADEREALASGMRQITGRPLQRPSMPEHIERDFVPLPLTQAELEERRRLAVALDSLERDARQEIHARTAEAVAPGQEEIVAAVEGLGGMVTARVVAMNIVGAALTPEALRELAENPLVAEIDYDHPGEPELDTSRVALMVHTGFWANNITGGVFDAGVLDTGVQTNHPALASHNYLSNMGSSDTGDHGTHVAGIMVSTDSARRGIAFGADKIIFARAGGITTSMPGMDFIASTGEADVCNYSFGNGTASSNDYTNTDRFFDGVIKNFSYLVSKSAGNGGFGTGNPTITHPAPAFNLMAVANVNDMNTATRSDDWIASSSSRGPTAGGRKKPDIAAPGSSISSTNAHWATGPHFVNKTGTSMAAPHVGGAVLLMYDMGVNNTTAAKAILINTADATEDNNTAGTGDDYRVDGSRWNRRYGWGYMHLGKAYLSGLDYFTDTVSTDTPRDRFQLYAGQMFDHEKATLVWERHVAYNGATFPTQFSALSDLDLFAYRESSNTLVSSSTSAIDNVEQLSIPAGSAGMTVLKVKAIGDFGQGIEEESFALATQENFVAKDGPSFDIDLQHPGNIEPGASFIISSEVLNTGDLLAHDLTITLEGATVTSGTNPVIVSSLAPSTKVPVQWTVSAASAEGGYPFRVTVTSNSYGEVFSTVKDDSYTVGAGEFIISNFRGNDMARSTDLHGGRIKAMGFTTPVGDDYTLDQVHLRLDISTIGADLLVRIFDDVNGLPVNTLATLVNPPLTNTGIDSYIFTPAAPLTLAQDTPYWLVVYNQTTGMHWMASNPPQLPTGIATHSGSLWNAGTGPNPPIDLSGIINTYAVFGTPVSEECYANCDGSTIAPILNVDDFTCFINEFAAAQALPHEEQLVHYANCDGSTIAPVLNVDDFTCFINAFAAGCP